MTDFLGKSKSFTKSEKLDSDIIMYTESPEFSLHTNVLLSYGSVSEPENLKGYKRESFSSFESQEDMFDFLVRGYTNDYDGNFFSLRVTADKSLTEYFEELISSSRVPETAIASLIVWDSEKRKFIIHDGSFSAIKNNSWRIMHRQSPVLFQTDYNRLLPHIRSLITRGLIEFNTWQ